ncbi:MAG TPA: hypothetical protein VEX37_15435 [Thermomicrobiales bacterium]|nr:hypothetical protein [Thermomicrobiales bacterium]
MSHDTIAMLAWSILGLSVALMFAGIAVRVAWPLFLAAVLSLAFSVAAMFSIGIYTLALAIVQLVIGIRLHRSVVNDRAQ